jgi:hypothetical protein
MSPKPGELPSVPGTSGGSASGPRRADRAAHVGLQLDSANEARWVASVRTAPRRGPEAADRRAPQVREASAGSTSSPIRHRAETHAVTLPRRGGGDPVPRPTAPRWIRLEGH